MTMDYRSASLLAATISLVAGLSGGASAADWDLSKDSPGDWLTYHGTYKSYHFSPLDQINASNVKQLKVAWMHHPGRSTRGLQSMPLVADGTLYYSGSYSRV
jgi:glucose dehydrogenase